MDVVIQQGIGRVLGFSGEELRFLEAARFENGPERCALQQAMTMTMHFNTTTTTIFHQNSSFLGNNTDPSEDAGGPVDIPVLRLVISAIPLTLLAGLSAYLRLGLHKKLAVAVVRCAGQLSALGFILVPIFVANKPIITCFYTMIMLLVAAAEAVSRPAQAYDGMLFEVLIAMGIACAVSITFGLAAIIQVSPWYDAQYLIPMLGMLLGNSCSSVAVGLSAALEELSTGRDKVEALLVLGATRVEATREVVVRSIRLALTPLLNSMNVVGIVSVPGMMTGQILGGSDPAVAAKYQIMIYFLVAISSSCSAIATIYAAVLTVCDSKHRLRAEKLQARASRTAGAVAWIAEQVKIGVRGVKNGAVAVGRKVKRALFTSRPAARSRHRYSGYLQGGGNGGSDGVGVADSVAVEEGRGDTIQAPLLGE